MMHFKSFVLLVITATLFNIACAQNAKRAFKKLHQLEGAWKMTNSKGYILEQWKKNSDNKLSSKSYQIKNEKDSTLLEEVNLIRTKDGIFYIPVVMDQNNRQPVAFKLIVREKTRFVFENKEHDFPQRIIYHLKDPNTLDARIEGMKNGNFKSSDFFYTRMD